MEIETSKKLDTFSIDQIDGDNERSSDFVDTTNFSLLVAINSSRSLSNIGSHLSQSLLEPAPPWKYLDRKHLALS